MGEVYRARDTKLGREVAIKVLPSSVANNPEKISRFEREARLLASLNHPNIATLHGLEETDQTHFLVMELVEGETLAERIARGPIPIEEALPLFKQIAEALEAAHDKGIIHRDLKPANIKITRDNRPKVLDFGLAKAFGPEFAGSPESESPTITREGTETGVILGTAAYMSPEQARGKSLDKRTDIWSFGCCLYEALTGRTAFFGETVSDTIAKILEREPDWAELPRNTPARLKELLARCLTKDATHRLRDIGDARLDMQGSLDEPRPSETHRSSFPFRWGAGAAVALGLIAVVWLFIAGRTSFRVAPVLKNPVQVTAAIGVEDYPSWSPGRTLAYHSNQSGAWDIWVTQVGAGQPVNRTQSASVDLYPSWSPDGAQIAFYSDRDGGGIYAIPALGGPARKLASAEQFREIRVQWSPDGTEIAFVVAEGGVAVSNQFVRILSLRTGAERRVPISTWGAAYDLAWSPSGAYFAHVVAGYRGSDVTQIFIQSIDDGDFEPVTDGLTNARSPAWSHDGDALYFVTNRIGGRDLWMQPLGPKARPRGEPIRITSGVGIRSFAFTPDDKRFAYSKGSEVANVWRVPILEDRLATWKDAEQVTFEQAHIQDFDVSLDGERLVVSSDRSGNADLWVLSLDDATLQVLADAPTPEWSPKFSWDGRWVAFSSYRTGKRTIWVAPSEGGPARLVADMDVVAGLWKPSWSPDGRLLAFNSFDIWVAPVTGGPARRLTDTGDPFLNMNAEWSPDGQHIVYTSEVGGVDRLWRVSVNGGEPAPLTQGPGTAPRWSDDGRRIYFIRSHAGREKDIWVLNLEDGFERPVTDLTGRRGQTFDKLAVRKNSIYFTWSDSLGDLWVMDVEQ